MDNKILWMKWPLWLITTGLFSLPVQASDSPVQFPHDFEQGVLYNTVHRGGITEQIYTRQETIDAVKAGNDIPSGSVITLVDYRDDQLYRYVVMEKRSGWGRDSAIGVSNGDWQFQAFHPDRSVNHSENLSRCFACHQSQADNDYVYTRDAMKKEP